MVNQADFYGLGIAPKLLEQLNRLRFTVPTPIQQKAIPIAIEGKDIIGVAQTGTGKTLAFGIPLIQRLAQIRGRGMVLVPTRELAIQVNETLLPFTKAAGMSTAVLIGGESMMFQFIALRKNPRIIVATPGRLLDFVGQQRLRLDDVGILILDEADRMLDMGFQPQIERILALVPARTERQTMLFSATMPPEIVKIASGCMNLPVRTEIAPPGSTLSLIEQELYIVNGNLKNVLLGKILDQYRGSVLLFSRTKIGANRIARALRHMHHAAADIHSDRTLDERKEALEGFKSGKYRILVATDIAARGIDVSNIELVINYDLPDDPENYVHRIGRTGRAGHKGHAISLATPDQKQDVQNIERLIRSTIPVSQHPEMPREQFEPAAAGATAAPSHRHDGGHGHHRGGHDRHGHGKPRPAGSAAAHHRP
jgi:ATP-dependent RNA helicase RhlE